MNKKLIVGILTIASLACAGCGFGGCNIISSSSNSGIEEPEVPGSGGDTHTEHTYNQQVATADYLCTEATCTAKATYYYSCSCGEKGTETFEYGDALGHTYVNGVCETCGDKIYAGASSLQFRLNDDGTAYSVSDCGYATEVEIPATYNDLPVTSIGDYAFYYCTSLTSVTIGNSVTSIGDWAFYGCTSLTSVTIGNSVTSIGSSAFWCCTSLTSITIPDSVTSIGYGAFFGDGAFYNCTSLTSITVDDNNANYKSIDGNLYSKDGTTLIQYAICKTDTAFTIPDSVTSIGDDAFQYCTSLERITIPDSVTSIGYQAFYYCTALTEINYNATACADLSYSDNIFYCAGQSGDGITVNIGVNVTKIPAYLFDPYSSSNAPKITSVVFAEGSKCTSIGSCAFEYCTALTNVTIGSSVTSIGADAFYGCCKLIEVYNLSSLNITAGSEDNGYVSYYAKNVYTSTSVASKLATTEDGYVFYEDGDTVYLMGYTGTATELTLPDKYNDKTYKIYTCAFSNCTSLTSIEIPDSVTSIGSDAFEFCTSLASITIPDSVTSIGSYAFYGCSSLTYNEYDNAYYLGDDTNKYVVLVKAKSTDITTCTIYENTKVIYYSAFRGCTSLTNITIPDSVKSIGDYAFYNCTALTEINYNATACADLSYSNYVFYCAGQSGDGITVNIGANVKKIPAYLFQNCSKITRVVFAEGSKCGSIGWYAFYGCTSLTSITIPDSVTSIDGAFDGCTSLTSVTIPDSVTSIGWYTFNGCTSLTSITVNDNNANYKSIDGNLYSKDGTTLIQYAIGKTDTAFTIPDSVTSIGSSAFRGCTSLTSITIPDSVTIIGKYAFSGCTAEIKWGDNPTITEIGEYAFAGYNGTSITIPDSVTSIGYSAFRNCTALTSVTFKNTTDWWYASISSATSRTEISSDDLADASTAATYLTSTYYNYYWKRT